MKEIRQIQEFVNYFKNNEKSPSDFKIGVELEHFIIDKDTLKSVNYYDEGGVKDTLEQMQTLGWEGKYEGENILGLSNTTQIISLEPGSQFEFSIKNPCKDIKKIEEEYFSFLNQIIPILEKKNQYLVATGYHPLSKIDDFPIIPKGRYDYMFEYFKSRGTHAHNMMKGTAALQVAVDFSSEEDYIKKFQVANALSPVIYSLFDNAYYFEGGVWDKRNLRAYIWENTDKDRSGVVEVAFDKDFGYQKYAQYILNSPPILIDNGEEVYYTGNQLTKEIFDPESYTQEEIEHILTMVFPDVRTKKYVEIRMMDSLPYPLNLAVVALWKGLLYHEENLNTLYNALKDINLQDINTAKEDIVQRGLSGTLKGKSIYEIAQWIVKLAKKGLEEEVAYILPLEEMIENKKNPYEITREKASLGRKESIEWCILNHLI